jgi:uncharacterized protein YdaU (DUF1376 family)
VGTSLRFERSEKRRLPRRSVAKAGQSQASPRASTRQANLRLHLFIRSFRFYEGAVVLPPDLIWPVFREKTIIRHFCLYSDFGKLFFPKAIRKSMKPSHIFILVLNLLITLALACFIVRLFADLQEKDRIIKELKAQQQVDGQKSLKAQKEEEAQIKLEAQKQLEAKKMRMVNDDLDKIDARLKRVIDQPSGFTDETKAQRDTQEELLRELASCAKTEIGVMVMEMQSLGFTNNAANAVLQENLDAFFRNLEDKIHAERLSYDYIDLGLRDSDHKKEKDAESAKSLQAAFAARRAIRNLKQNPK